MAADMENWTVEKWLKKLGLRKYRQAFTDNGYDIPELCANLNKDDLDAIGVTNKHHRSTLFTQSRKLLELVDKEELTVSEDSTDYQRGSPALETRSTQPNSGPLPSSPLTPSPGTIQSLPDYSEPWNSNVGQPVPTSPTSKGSFQFLKPANGTAGEPIDGSSPGHKGAAGSASRRKPPPSASSGADLPVFKREGSAGLTKLQLKLKIREELFSRNVVLSEYPYCKEDGSPDEQLLTDLAEELSVKFEVESLEMYDALQAVWSNANKSDFATAKRKRVKMATTGKEPTGNYDEPFDSVSSATSTPQDSAVVIAGKGSPPAPTKSSPGKSKKSRTLPSQATPSSPSQPNGCYDEPFDAVSSGEPKAQASPEKKKVVTRVESSKTLPSPRQQRGSVDSNIDQHPRGHSPQTSPKMTPLHPVSSKAPKFSLFKRKEKARSQSVRESDMKFLGVESNSGGKKAMISFPSKGTPLVAPSGGIRQVVSAENISEISSPNADQMAHLKSGIPPPLPSPRPQQPAESSEESDNSPSLGKTKKYGGKTFRKFITPPTLQRNQVARFDESSISSHSSAEADTPKRGRKHAGGLKNASSSTMLSQRKVSDDEYEGKAWLQTSKSFDNLSHLNHHHKQPDKDKKKSKTAKFITRIFKRKSVTPASMKRSGKGKSMKDHNRDSYTSNASSIAGPEMESRERCLTASISMPDISNIKTDRKPHRKPRDDDSYAEVFDAIKPSPEDLARYSPRPGKKSEREPAHQSANCDTPSTKSSRQSHGSQPSSPRVTTSPLTTSPLAITPPHQKMFIRAGSESSGPDNITITIKSTSAPEQGSPEFILDVTGELEPGMVNSSSGGAISAASFDSVKSADSEDMAGTIIMRTGSADSSASSEVSGGGSLPRKRPPVLPKPAALSAKIKPTATSPAHKAEPEADKPPPKPTRGVSRKNKNTTPVPTGGSGEGENSPTKKGDDETSPTTTPKRAPVENGGPANVPNGVRVSPRPTRSSAPNTSNQRPPPKPMRATRHPQSKSESESGDLSTTRGESATPSPLNPAQSSSETGPAKTPPPKPARRGKSVKIIDPEDSKTGTGYSSTTLPSHFKVDSKLRAASPVSTGRSVSPKPVPKPRTSVGTLPQPVKRPRANIRTDREN